MDKLSFDKDNCLISDINQERNLQETSKAFIQRLSDSDDKFDDSNYDGYVIDIEAQSYDP